MSSKDHDVFEEASHALVKPALGTKRKILTFLNLIACSSTLLYFFWKKKPVVSFFSIDNHEIVFFSILFIHAFSLLYNVSVFLKLIKNFKIIDHLNNFLSVGILCFSSVYFLHFVQKSGITLLSVFAFQIILIIIVGFLWGRVLAITWASFLLIHQYLDFKELNDQHYRYDFLTIKESTLFEKNLKKDFAQISEFLKTDQSQNLSDEILNRLKQLKDLSHVDQTEIFEKVLIKNFKNYVISGNTVPAYNREEVLLLLNNLSGIRRYQIIAAERKLPLPISTLQIILILLTLISIFPVLFQSNMVAKFLKLVPVALKRIKENQENLMEENLRLGSEINVAKQIQDMVVPQASEYQAFKELDISGFMEASKEVGGDYFEVFPDFENNSCFMSIGDVTDHGLQSGVVMLMTQTAYRTVLEAYEGEASDLSSRMIDILDCINRVIYKNTTRMQDDRNLSLSLLFYHRGKLKVVGQHENILILRAGSDQVEVLSTDDLGISIGLIQDIRHHIAEIEIELNQDDIVCFYTDGTIEAESEKGDFYGLIRMKEAILAHRDLDSQNINRKIVEDVKNFIGMAEIHDDITLLTLKVREIALVEEELSPTETQANKIKDQNDKTLEETGAYNEMVNSSSDQNKKTEKHFQSIKFFGSYNYIPDDFTPDDQVTWSSKASNLRGDWDRCGLLSDHISSYFSNYTEDEKTKNNFINIVSTIANELIENIAKFSDQEKDDLEVIIKRYKDTLCIMTTNYATKKSLAPFEKYVKKLLDEKADYDSMYMDTLVSKAEDESKSGVGLLMILKDFPVKIGCSFSQLENEVGASHLHRINIRAFLSLGELN